MKGYRINWFRLICAAVFFMELGSYFGVDHLRDQSPAELVASGIAFLLFSVTVERIQ